jgi:hypothetical protein
MECLTATLASPILAENDRDLLEDRLLLKQRLHHHQRVLLSYIQQLQELSIIRSCKRIEEMLLKLLTWPGRRFGCQKSDRLMLDIPFIRPPVKVLIRSTEPIISETFSKSFMIS